MHANVSLRCMWAHGMPWSSWMLVGCAGAACRATAHSSEHKHACKHGNMRARARRPRASCERGEPPPSRAAAPAAVSGRLQAHSTWAHELRQQQLSSPRRRGRGCMCRLQHRCAQRACTKGESRACLSGGAGAPAVVGGRNGCVGTEEHAHACMQARGQACTAAQHSTGRTYRRTLTSAN